MSVAGVASPSTRLVGRPYEPSFVDRITGWIDSLPGHGWWFYPLLLLAFVTYVHVALWLVGTLPWWTTSPFPFIYVAYGPYGLVVVHYLDRTARRAIAEFRPALDLPDSSIDALTYELTTLPSRGLAPWLALGLSVAMLVLLTAPPEVTITAGGFPAAFATLGPFIAFGYGGFAVVTYHTIRQLRLVGRLHASATRLDLFRDRPLYAFSRLTARTGIAFAIVGYYSLTVNGAFVTVNAAALLVTGLNFLVGIACFILPLLGIHGRLVAEKATLIDEANDRLRLTMAELYGRIDRTQIAGIKDVNDSLAGIVASREIIQRLPTWPWPPQLLRGFVTALALPVIIYVTTRQVGQLLGP